MKCIHCQKQHAHYETYCSTTGKQIDDSLIRKYTYDTLDFCVSCGESNKGVSLHCSKCGTEAVKLSSKKITMDKLIDQGLTAIPDFKNSAAFTKGKINIKEASLEHKNYIKKTPLILLPATISIAIILLISAFIVNKFKDNMALIGGFLELGGINIFDADILNAYLSEELGTQVNVPDFPLFTMLISLMHNINFSFGFEMLESGDSEVIKFQESNIFLGLLIIPIIALIIGAIVYGRMARKNNWDFWRGIIYSTALYTVFLAIVSFLARFKADASGTNYYDEMMKIKVQLLPSFFNTLITGIVISGVIFVFVGYISYSGKQVLTKIEDEWKYFKYAMYAIAATVIGLVLHLVNAVIAIKNSTDELATNIISEVAFDMIPESLYIMTSLNIAVINWYLSLFGKLNLNIQEDGMNVSIAYSWFFKDNLYEFGINEMIKSTTFINPFIFVIIIFAILGGVGFLLTKHQLLDFKEVGIIAAIFTAIQLAMLYFVNVNIEFLEDTNKNVITMGVALFQQLLVTVIFSYTAIIAGSFAKIKFFFSK